MTVKHDDTPAAYRVLPPPSESDCLSCGFESEDREGMRPTTERLLLNARGALNKGDVRLAIDCLDRLLQIDPDNLRALIEKGALLYRIGKVETALGCFAAARQIAPDDELVLTNLAVALGDAGKPHEAVIAFRRVLELYPGNLHVHHQLRRLISTIVPFWHVRMLNDAKRNDAFESAIRAALDKEGRHAHILDIGAGSGLLSMMAARAGATNVVTCEKIPVIAEQAERIVALNGFEKQIRVIRKNSNQINLGRDIDSRADILISEIISSDLLAENVLDTFQDAHSRLLRKGATIIPRAATAVGCLAESEVLHKYAFVGDVSGFDISPFTELSAATSGAWNNGIVAPVG